jgi:hypothetical protein
MEVLAEQLIRQGIEARFLEHDHYSEKEGLALGLRP